MVLRSLVFCVLSWFLQSPCLAQDGSKPLRVNVKNVYVQGLLGLSANVAQKNAAIGGYSVHRMSMVGEFSDERAFFDAFARQVDARVVRHEQAEVFVGPCIPSQPLRRQSFGTIPVSLNFARVNTVEVLTLMQGMDPSRGAEPPPLPDLAFGLIGLRLKDVGVSSVVEIVSIASGVEIVDGRSGLSVRRQADCGPEPVTSQEIFHPSLRLKKCRPVEGAPKRCEPLELYRLENIVMRGWLLHGARRIAVAETPDGLTWGIQVGDYLGEHFGKVVAMDEQGLLVREVLENPYGFWYEQRIAVGFDNVRRPVLDHEPPP